MNNLSKDDAIFALSFISNADFGLDAPVGDPSTPKDGTLWTNAQSRVNQGLDAINKNLPDNGQASLTWGPYIATSQSKDPDATNDSVTDNAMLVASLPDPSTPNKQLLVVSLAGTSDTSYKAAMVEDFGVAMTGLYVPPGVSTDAKVYTGGNGILSDMVGDPTNPKQHPGWLDVTQKNALLQGFLVNLLSQVSKLVAAKKSVEVVVTGHSLGGGLAPLLVAYLGSYSKLTQQAGVSVSCYTYAGPTAGDSEFLKFLGNATSAGTYKATVNPLDLVPMAWDPSTLPLIPGLYADQEGYDGDQGTDYVVAGAVVWAQSLPDASPAFEKAPADNTNKLQAVGLKFTDEIKAGIDTVADLINNDSDYAKLKANMETLFNHAPNSPGNFDEKSIKHFLAFGKEGGYQHVRSYIDQLIDPTDFKDLNAFLVDFMSAKVGDKDAEKYDKGNILNTILTEAANYYS